MVVKGSKQEEGFGFSEWSFYWFLLAGICVKKSGWLVGNDTKGSSVEHVSGADVNQCEKSSALFSSVNCGDSNFFKILLVSSLILVVPFFLVYCGFGQSQYTSSTRNYWL